jgi:Putative addiction module component
MLAACKLIKQHKGTPKSEVSMSVAIKLEQMTTADKISAMEYLWDDLCRHASESLSPAWHNDLLVQREDAVTVGESQFLDWEQAKKKIRESLS